MIPPVEELYDVFVQDILPRMRCGDPWTAEQVSDWMVDTERERPDAAILTVTLTYLAADGLITIVDGNIYRS